MLNPADTNYLSDIYLLLIHLESLKFNLSNVGGIPQVKAFLV